MVAPRTERRSRRRELLKSIIDNLILVYGKNDTEIERISIIKLNSINIDTFDFLKWLRIDIDEYRYSAGSHIYTNRLDTTATTKQENKKE